MTLYMPAQDRRTSLWLGVAGVVWIIGLGIGLRASLNYENGPAAAGQPPPEWPSQSGIHRRAGLPTIVVMAHPHCPCTRATVGELAVLMARVQKRVTAVVVFVIPNGVPEIRAEEKGLELACHVHTDVPEDLFGDPLRLRQVILNLVGNAIKFTPKGEVVVEVGVAGKTGEDISLHFWSATRGLEYRNTKSNLFSNPSLRWMAP